MKRTLLAAVVAALGLTTPAFADQTCQGGALNGQIIGGTSPNCAYLKVNPDGSIPVGSSTTGSAVTPTDRGGSLVTGGTAQNAMASNTSRKGCWIMNPNDATEKLFVSSSTTATTVTGAPNDADLNPGQSWACNQGGNVIQSAISVNAATNGHKWEAKETQ